MVGELLKRAKERVKSAVSNVRFRRGQVTIANLMAVITMIIFYAAAGQPLLNTFIDMIINNATSDMEILMWQMIQPIISMSIIWNLFDYAFPRQQIQGGGYYG